MAGEQLRHWKSTHQFVFKLLHGKKWGAELGTKGPWKMWFTPLFRRSWYKYSWSLRFWKKWLLWHVVWNRKLTSRPFSAWTKLESGYCSSCRMCFCYQKTATLQSFQEVHNVAGVLTKKKCLSNWWRISVNEPKEMKHGVLPSMAKYCHGNG